MPSWRLNIVFFVILLAGFGIIARMFYIQIVRGGYYAALAQGQNTEYVEYAPPRGSIFLQDKFAADENGLFTVATPKDWPMVYAVPKDIDDAPAVASMLAPIFAQWEEFELDESMDGENYSNIAEEKRQDMQDGIEEDLATRLAKKDDPYEPLKRKISDEQADAIKSLDLAGIYIGKEKLRHYPGETLASHVLGFVGYKDDKRVGQYGIEGFYEEVLRGSKENSQLSFFGFGKSSGDAKLLKHGSDLVLSIDYNIQFMLEEKLLEAKESLSAEGGSAIVMNPKNGEIIALASTEAFDPNEYSKVENINVYLSDAVQKMFEPGSIFKPFTMAAALDAQAVAPFTEYEDKGYITVWDRTFRNANQQVYGVQNMTNVLELSLNTGVVFVQQKLGKESFREYIQKFGFGARTEVDLQGEVLGDINNLVNTSRDVNFATVSFGQGIAVTPIQLVTAFSAFANGGKMTKPHVVKEVINSDGDRILADPEIIGKPISPKTAAQMTTMLVSVVDNGFGKKASVRGYKIAGKTGTAQVPDKEKGGYSDKVIHSFIGFAPAYDPRFIALIKLENPQSINFSADTVAPLFSKVAEYILNYYEIPPDS